jgi:NTP pyrophosphatase (non-canonical NTP hydrolase)
MDLKDYQSFVFNKTSIQSKDFDAFINELRSLNQSEVSEYVNIPLMLTAAVGLSAEAGEFTEIVKKILFQGKPLNEENRYHMKRELGDTFFYLMMAAESLGYDAQDLINENVDKLDARYKNGFSVEESENRVATDL